jgi:transcriptional regulator with XRE-family HTH domain
MTYLSQTKLTYAEFGALIGRSRSEICRFALGKRSPTVEIALRIQKATDGLVKPEDFSVSAGGITEDEAA